MCSSHRAQVHLFRQFRELHLVHLSSCLGRGLMLRADLLQMLCVYRLSLRVDVRHGGLVPPRYHFLVAALQVNIRPTQYVTVQVALLQLLPQTIDGHLVLRQPLFIQLVRQLPTPILQRFRPCFRLWTARKFSLCSHPLEHRLQLQVFSGNGCSVVCLALCDHAVLLVCGLRFKLHTLQLLTRLMQLQLCLRSRSRHPRPFFPCIGQLHCTCRHW